MNLNIQLPNMILICKRDYSCQVFTLEHLKSLLKHKFLDDYFIVLDFGFNKISHFCWEVNNHHYSLDDLEQDFKLFLINKNLEFNNNIEELIND